MSSLVRLGTQFVKSFYSKIDSQKMDPVSSLIVIATACFKEKGTRIAFSNNRLYTQQPKDYKTGLGAYRFFTGSSREDIGLLDKIIQNTIKLHHPEENEHIRTLFEYTLDGLKWMKENTYQKSNATKLAIDRLQTLIQNVSEKNENLTETEMKIKNLWKAKEIEIINTNLELAKKQQEIDSKDKKQWKVYIDTVEGYVINKSALLNKIFDD